MDSLPFVFSNQPKWRVLRHVVFWFSWFIFQAFLYSFSPSPALQQKSFLVRISLTAPESLIYLVPHMFLAYSLMYIVIPRFVITGKYGSALVLTTFIFVIAALISGMLSITIIDYLRNFRSHQFLPDKKIVHYQPLYVPLGGAMLAGLRGAITIGGLAAAIKLMKCFYEKEQAALNMEKDKVNAELQMLKAQLHPHFLFNTLNNIYSYTQDVSVVASNMIFGLSELLRYMLYECNQPFVPLDKEIKMIGDYIALEKVRYDAHLDLSVNMPESSGTLRIAPLLLLPLVENCFKHGASKMIRDPWISIELTLDETVLVMKLVNGKVPGLKASSSGIGTANTQKRLDLIYAGKYEF
ncbi:sensor histidine kinase [Arcticibacter eurypsychrophilus]|uniref:sensor histidine kinase n=1 Tax=Arcticibacter eurypsychrophilus TaxID=1434752 RepID=UPI00084D2DF0|nr:histidine kinase [Arcticibacter eurypsychrophilus]